MITRVHAACNCVLHPARPCLLHSAGYIVFIAKLINEEFAGTQLYRQRVCFFLPLRLLTLYQHNQCGFLEKNAKRIFFYNLVLIYSTSFSNVILSIFRSGKDSFIKSIFSLSLSLSREKKSTSWNQEEKLWQGWGLNPRHSGDSQAPNPLHHEDI